MAGARALEHVRDSAYMLPSVESLPGVQVAAACRTLIGLPGDYKEPVGYDGLALAIIDAIWSIGVRYGGVINVVERYRTWVASTLGQSAAQRTGPELVADIAHSGGPRTFATAVLDNTQRTSSRGGVLKAEAVLLAAQALADQGVVTTVDLLDHVESPELKAAWLSVPGQSSGISWHYLLMNARYDDIKADRMVCRFVARALGEKTVPSTTAYGEVVAAHLLLTADTPGLSRKALDHAIWGFERRR